MAITTLYKQPSCADDTDPDALSVDKARENILHAITPLQTQEKLALRSALGRVLAKDIISPINVPAHTNSAMDGYALIGSDLPHKQSRAFDMIGQALAGQPYQGACLNGQCVRIMTGAPMPEGTDTVIMQEQAQVESDKRIIIGTGHRTGQNVRKAGEDIPQGAIVLSAGRHLVPADLGILSSLGFAEIPVWRRPRVAFFSTGDELRPLGTPLGDGEIYDSNRYSLYGMLKRLDVDILDLGIVPDDPQTLKQALQNGAQNADIIITSGGVSVGDADHIKPVLQETGKSHFWKIAMKPGRPLTFGQIGQAHFFGLPGNPVAVMVTFYQFVQPAIQTLAGEGSSSPLTLRAKCMTPLRKKPGRYEFLRGIYRQDDDGDIVVEKSGLQGSGILTSMSRANCFILLPEENDGIEQGERVTIQPFTGLI